MAKEAKEALINGRQYSIGMHGPDTGDEIIAYLTKNAAPVFVALQSLKPKDDEAEDAAQVGKTLAGALSNLNGKEHAKFMRLLLSVCTVDGMPLNGAIYDSHYIGEQAERYQAAAEVISHNGFFELVGNLGGALRG